MLLDFADYVLEERFAKVDDVVSRVLGGGVANRWLSRLRPTDRWMDEQYKRCEALDVDECDTADRELLEFFHYALTRDRERALKRQRAGRGSAARGAEAEAGGEGVGGVAVAVAPPSYEVEPAWPELTEEAMMESNEWAAPVTSFIRQNLYTLTVQSRHFCSKDLEITHKNLIKEQRLAGGKALAPKVMQAQKRQRAAGSGQP